MIKRILVCSFLAVCCSIIVSAQQKPAWLNEIEAEIAQDKSNLRIAMQSYHTPVRGEFSFSYIIFLRANNAQAGEVRINSWRSDEQRFDDRVEWLSLSKAVKGIPRSKLKDIGDEGYIWTNAASATKILFRKGLIFVEIFAPEKEISGIEAEELARTLAEYVEKHIP